MLMNISKVILMGLLYFLLLDKSFPQESHPLKDIVEAMLTLKSHSNALLEVRLKIPDGYQIYQESLQVEFLDKTKSYQLHKLMESPLQKEKDPISGEEKMFFTGTATSIFEISFAELPRNFKLAISYQGCKETICFLPVQLYFAFDDVRENVAVAGKTTTQDEVKKGAPDGKEQSVNAQQIKELLKKFKVANIYYGYMNKKEFMDFLQNKFPDKHSEIDGKKTLLKKISLLFFIFIGGLALNLTPCVLPMIPINLAIIGAGARALSKMQGMLLGGIFGAGIALAYGVLGMIVVLTGGTFGAINASAIFNFVIAVIFIIMALAMAGVIPIDFSRWQSQISIGKMNIFAIFLLGALSAILAGACVAPVVISTLIFSANLYAEGHIYALLLPFLLGVGMALPWPIVGTGIKLLPQPGKWMNVIKYAFAALIMIIAMYYLYTAYTLSPLFSKDKPSYHSGMWETDAVQALNAALKDNKPVLVDFWASWCKSCKMMESTTFSDPDVNVALNNFIKLKVQAEKPSEPETKQILGLFDVKGLPTYIILTPVLP